MRAASFDHPIGAEKENLRDGHTDLARCSEINNELELRDLLDWQF